MAININYKTGEIADILRWAQSVIDWADGDPAKGTPHRGIAADGGVGMARRCWILPGS